MSILKISEIQSVLIYSNSRLLRTNISLQKDTQNNSINISDIKIGLEVFAIPFNKNGIIFTYSKKIHN